MLERRSALASAHAVEASRITLREAPDFSLTQVINPSRDAIKLLGSLPGEVGEAKVYGARTVVMTGPHQYWVIGPVQDDAAKQLLGQAVVTPLSSSRTRIELAGEEARTILAKSAAIDFHASAFKPGHFVMTGIHHTPVLIHCTGEHSFHLYALRTFALDLWEWLADHATGL